MKAAPKVLTITPTYHKRKRYLDDVLHNIAAQKYRNYRGIIVVNNSKPDYYYYVLQLVNIIENETARFHSFIVEDIGQITKKDNYKGSMGSVAYNRGLDYAVQHDYDYALLVQDDIALPDVSIRTMLKPFRKFKDCGISALTCYMRWSGDGGMQTIMDKVGEVVPELKGKADQKVPMVMALEDEMNPRMYYRHKYLKAKGAGGAMMIPRKVFEVIKLRDHLKDGHIGNDYAYCIDTLEKFGLYTYINTRLWTPHMQEESDGKLVIY